MRAAVLAAAIVIVASRAAPAGGCPVKPGPHFRVICHFDDDVVAAAALETVEAVWPVASNLYGLPDAPLDPPLDVHLYRNAAEYTRVERELSGGRFAANLAFSDIPTRASYVALQPDLTDEALGAIGLTAQTRHTLAHEAAHLVSYRASPGFRSLPNWISEASAIWCEREATAARGWSAGADEDPFVATDMIIAKKLLDGGALPTATQILREETKDYPFRERYAVQWLLFRRLMTRNDGAAFRAALVRASRLPEGSDFARRFVGTLTEPYGTEGFDGLDLDFEQYVRSQTPAWDEASRALSTAGDVWTQTAFGSGQAAAWRTAPVGCDAYDVRGQFEILPGTGNSQQMQVLLGRDADEGFVLVAFAARDGVSIWRWRRVDDTWDRIGAASTNVVQLWRRTPFRISVDGSKVTVRVDGNEVTSADLKDRKLAGPWGLGVQAGAAGNWRGVRVEVAKPPK